MNDKLVDAVAREMYASTQKLYQGAKTRWDLGEVSEAKKEKFRSLARAGLSVVPQHFYRAPARSDGYRW